MKKKYQKYADFAFVYIEEAHPTGGWTFKHQQSINEHQNLQERIAAAQKIHNVTEEIPIYIDGMDDKLNRMFGAYPERLYIIKNNKVEYQGKMGPFGYKLDEVENWLQKNFDVQQ